MLPIYLTICYAFIITHFTVCVTNALYCYGIQEHHRDDSEPTCGKYYELRYYYTYHRCCGERQYRRLAQLETIVSGRGDYSQLPHNCFETPFSNKNSEESESYEDSVDSGNSASNSGTNSASGVPPGGGPSGGPPGGRRRRRREVHALNGDDAHQSAAETDIHQFVPNKNIFISGRNHQNTINNSAKLVNESGERWPRWPTSDSNQSNVQFPDEAKPRSARQAYSSEDEDGEDDSDNDGRCKRGEQFHTIRKVEACCRGRPDFARLHHHNQLLNPIFEGTPEAQRMIQAQQNPSYIPRCVDGVGTTGASDCPKNGDKCGDVLWSELMHRECCATCRLVEGRIAGR